MAAAAPRRSAAAVRTAEFLATLALAAGRAVLAVVLSDKVYLTKPLQQRIGGCAAWAHGLVIGQIRIDVISMLPTASGEFTVEHGRGVG